MRKLAIAVFSLAAAVFAAVRFIPVGTLPYIAAAFAAAGAVLMFLRDEWKLRGVISCFGICAGFLCVFIFSESAVIPAYELDGRSETVTAVVTDFPQERDYGEKLAVKLKTDGLPPVKAVIYVFDDSGSGVKPGNTIEFTAKFSRADMINGEDSDYYTSYGIFLSGVCSGNISVTDSGGEAGYFYRYISYAVSGVVDEAFPDYARGMMKALLTGDRGELYNDYALTSSMKTDGVYHIVAVSGMHVCVLAGFIMTIVRRKRAASIVTIPVLLVFMAVTGFTASVVRAVVMQIFIIAAPFCKRESDGITSLSAGLLLLLLINPYSVNNVGLQLSFAATLGIITLTPKLNDSICGAVRRRSARAEKNGIVRFLVSSVSTSVGAMVFTVPLTAVYFGYVSIIALLANILIPWAVSAVFCCGIIVCVAGAVFIPAAKIAAIPVALMVKYIIIVSESLAAVPLAAVYTDNVFIVAWLVYVYLLIVVSALMKAGLRRCLLPAALGTVALCAAVMITSLSSSASAFEVSVRDVGQGESVVMTSGDYTAVMDCGSATDPYCGDETAKYIKSLGRNAVDILILSHFHEDHISGVMELMQSVKVSSLAVPVPEADDGAAWEIISYAVDNGIKVIYVDSDTSAVLGKLKLSIFAPLGYDGDGENENGIIVLASCGSEDALITGDADASVEKALTAHAALPDIELLVAGHHGSKTSTCEELLEDTTPDIAAISVGYNSYGHPSGEVLERLEESGAEVYRTDENGSITVELR